MSNFSIFFPSDKKISSSQVKKYPAQRLVGLLFTAGQKQAWVRAHHYLQVFNKILVLKESYSETTSLVEENLLDLLVWKTFHTILQKRTSWFVQSASNKSNRNTVS